MEVLTFADIINKSIIPPFDGPSPVNASAHFRVAEKAGIVGSNGTVVKGAAEFGGFDHFNWLQIILSIEKTDSCRGPGVDPLPRGNCPVNPVIQALASLFPDNIAARLIDIVRSRNDADQYVWYWDEVPIPGREEFTVQSNTKDTYFEFFDDPGDFDIGGELVFYTYLVGVLDGDKGAVFAPPTFIDTGFKWKFIQTKPKSGVVEGIQFFQDSFFEPGAGGTIEFLGFMTEEDWAAELPYLRSLGLDIYGLDVDSPVSVDEPPVLLLIFMGAVGLSLSRRRRFRIQQP